MKKLILLMGLFWALPACSFYKVDSQSLTDQYYPSKASTNEVTYLEVVNRPHAVIATVTVNAERNQRLNDVIERMKQQAALLGGDAITNIRTNSGEGKWAKIKPQKLFANANIRTNFVADVVVFTSDVRAEAAETIPPAY